MAPREGKAPAFQFYAADWLADGDVQRMSAAEEGTYCRLLCYAFREHGLPEDPAEIRKLTKLPAGMVWRRAWSAISIHFPEGHGCGCGEDHGPRRRNPRQERDRQMARELSEERSSAGSAGADARWHGKRMANAMANDSSASASASASESESESERGDRAPDPQIASTVQNLATALRDIDPPSASANAESVHLQRVALVLIDRIRHLEAGRDGDRFNPDAWWGKTRGPIAAKVATLAQLGKRLEVGDRPENLWAYCEATYREKEANYHGERAEAASAAKLKAAGRDTG